MGNSWSERISRGTSIQPNTGSIAFITALTVILLSGMVSGPQLAIHMIVSRYSALPG